MNKVRKDSCVFVTLYLAAGLLAYFELILPIMLSVLGFGLIYWLYAKGLQSPTGKWQVFPVVMAGGCVIAFDYVWYTDSLFMGLVSGVAMMMIYAVIASGLFVIFSLIPYCLKQFGSLKWRRLICA